MIDKVTARKILYDCVNSDVDLTVDEFKDKVVNGLLKNLEKDILKN